MFCVLDIESSGGSFGKEAIIEIALFKYDGAQVIDQLISLVHPHKKVQPFVTKMTGITDKMLIRAPRFHEIAKRIIEVTEECILVGHNVSFDYRMLRQEYSRLGYTFERKTLDTISLSEELIPGLPAYGLDKVTKELGIFNPNKHRAEGDARATLELFQILQEKDRKKEIGVLGQSVVANSYTDDKVNDLLRSVKKNKGILYLHDADGKLLYITATDNAKGSLNNILLADSDKGQELRQKVSSVRLEETGNMLVANIKKHEELKQAKPLYNSKSKVEFPFGIYADSRGKSVSLTVKPLADMGSKRPLCKVESFKKGLRLSRLFKRGHAEELREEVLGKLKHLPSQAIFVGKGRSQGEFCAFVIAEKSFKGYFYYKLNQQLSSERILNHALSPISNQKVSLQWLKQAILQGEVRAFQGAKKEV